MESKSTTDETQIPLLSSVKTVDVPTTHNDLETEAEALIQQMELLQTRNPTASSQVMSRMSNVFISNGQNSKQVTLYNYHMIGFPVRVHLEVARSCAPEDKVTIACPQIQAELDKCMQKDFASQFFRQFAVQADHFAVQSIKLPTVAEVKDIIKNKFNKMTKYENVELIQYHDGDDNNNGTSEILSDLDFIVIPPKEGADYFEIRFKDEIHVGFPMGDKQYSVPDVIDLDILIQKGVKACKDFIQAGPAVWSKVYWSEKDPVSGEIRACGCPDKGMTKFLWYSDWGQMLRDRFFNEARGHAHSVWRVAKNGAIIACREHLKRYNTTRSIFAKKGSHHWSDDSPSTGGVLCFSTVVDKAIREFVNERTDEELSSEIYFLSYLIDRQLLVEFNDFSAYHNTQRIDPALFREPHIRLFPVPERPYVAAECCFYAFGKEGVRLLTAIEKWYGTKTYISNIAPLHVLASCYHFYLFSEDAQNRFANYLTKRTGSPVSWRLWVAMISDGALPADPELLDQHYKIFEKTIKTVGVRFSGVRDGLGSDFIRDRPTSSDKAVFRR